MPHPNYSCRHIERCKDSPTEELAAWNSRYVNHGRVAKFLNAATDPPSEGSRSHAIDSPRRPSLLPIGHTCDRKNGRIAKLSARQTPAPSVFSAHQDSRKKAIPGPRSRCGEPSLLCSFGPCIELISLSNVPRTFYRWRTTEKLAKQYFRKYLLVEMQVAPKGNIRPAAQMHTAQGPGAGSLCSAVQSAEPGRWNPSREAKEDPGRASRAVGRSIYFADQVLSTVVYCK